MHPKVFREYDIRGIVGSEILDDDVITLGKAFGTYMARQGKSRIVVGRDCRLSSDRFRDLLIKGLTTAGMDVVDLRQAIIHLSITVSRYATATIPYLALRSRSFVQLWKKVISFPKMEVYPLTT